MLLTITHLKAPWPEGAKVGDVIDLPSVPVWALGKCQPSSPDEVPAEAEPAAQDQAAGTAAQGADGPTPAPPTTKAKATKKG